MYNDSIKYFIFIENKFICVVIFCVFLYLSIHIYQVEMYLCLFVCFDVLTYLTNPFTDFPQILIENSVEPREYFL